MEKRPIEKDQQDVIRFKPNRIVRWCLNNDTDLEAILKLKKRGEFTENELKEFCQLIGYSVDAYDRLFGKEADEDEI